MRKRAYIESAYQCTRGELDVVHLVRYFELNGWDIVHDPSEADLVAVGGCAFTKCAEDECIRHLAEVRHAMRPGVPMVVGGCIAGIRGSRISEAVQGIPLDVAGRNVDELISAQVPLASVDDPNTLDPTLDQPACNRPGNGGPMSCLARLHSTSLWRYIGWFRYGKPQVTFSSEHSRVFYIRVARGCLDECTYCAIKFATGDVRSKPISAVRREFEKGLEEGYRVFYLVGEDVGAYGQDQDTSITDLLRDLLSREGDYQLVISDCNPHWLVKYSSEFLDIVSAHSGRILQIELPVQSGSDRTLARMGRHYTAGDVEGCLLALRRVAPSVRLKTHVIIGFPGETDSDFQETLQFMKRVKPDRIASYVYSDRPGTQASKLPNKVPALIKTLRYWRFNRETLLGDELESG